MLFKDINLNLNSSYFFGLSYVQIPLICSTYEKQKTKNISIVVKNLKSSPTYNKAALQPASKQMSAQEFKEWFVGFCDGESNFNVYIRKDKQYVIQFMFKIELHIDDIQVIYFLKERLVVVMLHLIKQDIPPAFT